MTLNQEAPRRERILAAATAEFATRGFAGARVERIATAAGVNKQLLFHYFGSKAGLHRAAVTSITSRLTLDAPVGRAPRDQLRDFTARLVAAASQHPALLGSAAFPDADDLAMGWRLRAVSCASQILQDGQRRGYFRDDIDPDAVAKVVVAASLGLEATVDVADQATDSGRIDQFRDVLLRMVTDYCTWR